MRKRAWRKQTRYPEPRGPTIQWLRSQPASGEVWKTDGSAHLSHRRLRGPPHCAPPPAPRGSGPVLPTIPTTYGQCPSVSLFFLGPAEARQSPPECSCSQGPVLGIVHSCHYPEGLLAPPTCLRRVPGQGESITQHHHPVQASPAPKLGGTPRTMWMMTAMETVTDAEPGDGSGTFLAALRVLTPMGTWEGVNSNPCT